MKKLYLETKCTLEYILFLIFTFIYIIGYPILLYFLFN